MKRRDNTNTSIFATLLISSLVALACEDLFAAQTQVEHYGVSFDSVCNIDDHRLTFSGAGPLTYKGVFRVYIAALYVDRNADDFESTAKRIEVEYRVGAKARRFNEAGRRILEDTLSSDEMGAIRDRFNRFSALYPDSRKGDRCSVTFVPGRGTLLHYNGELLGEEAGDDFARHYFSIWLGESPADTELRDALRKGSDAIWQKTQ